MIILFIIGAPASLCICVLQLMIIPLLLQIIIIVVRDSSCLYLKRLPSLIVLLLLTLMLL